MPAECLALSLARRECPANVSRGAGVGDGVSAVT